ncbi:hypothetical protein LTR66_000189 [Elasticomyces elasticus]|nr:hypothetical protein LTR50_006210 [Elasticomyces elasticus]KAK5001057.1 hypothetical protein LTR66_000189 [Elasticomyces elasticus]
MQFKRTMIVNLAVLGYMIQAGDAAAIAEANNPVKALNDVKSVAERDLLRHVKVKMMFFDEAECVNHQPHDHEKLKKEDKCYDIGRDFVSFMPYLHNQKKLKGGELVNVTAYRSPGCYAGPDDVTIILPQEESHCITPDATKVFNSVKWLKWFPAPIVVCATDADCDSDEACVQQSCVDKPDNTVKRDTDCGNDAECDDDELCIADSCIDYKDIIARLTAKKAHSEL